MANQSSVETFLRFVGERFAEFKDKFNKVIAVLGGTNPNEKIPAVKAALDAGTALQSALSSQDHPAWLGPLMNAMNEYVARAGDSHGAMKLIATIGGYYAAMNNHQWTFGVVGETPFDFDGLYRNYEAASTIPELFDRLVALLEEIVKSKQIDSCRVIQALETIIATLKRNRNGSYFSVVCTWDFVGTYLKNIGWNVLKEVPLLRVPVNALLETLQKMDKEMSKLHEGIQTDLQKQLNTEFPSLTYQPLSLPEPLLVLPEETVIDVESKPTGADEKPSQ